jgi:LPS-assembly protein
MWGGARRAVLTAALIMAALLARPATAQQALPADIPALISADQITYDENLAIVTASGNVEISYEDSVLLADSVSYNIRSNLVTASGNVSLIEPSGDVVFADYVELTDDLREGFIRDIRVLMSDQSRLAAASGLRTGGNKTVFKRGVFSPCELCREDPTRAPLWQLKAAKVEHDQEERVIRYRDVWMEIYGVPVFYTPYFEHPDPTVDRKSGFLAPTLGNSELLGTTYQQPYFWAISPDKDLTVAPILTTEQGVALTGQYRQLFTNGSIDLRGSGAIADRVEEGDTVRKDRLRGHIDSTVRFDFDDTWRGGLDLQRASDDTYLRTYNFSSEQTLTSRAFAEAFDGRNYASVNNYLYQGLRSTDNDGESPIVLPLVDFNYISDPGIGGSTYGLDANFMTLTRREGRDSRRMSLAANWRLPYYGLIGDVYNLVARVQTDGYWTNGVDPESDAVNPVGPTDSDFTGRIFPQLAVQWRYPWVSHVGDVNQVIEPMAQAVAAPNGANPGEIPNEDSLDFEFDDTNLFSLNRFTGVDRVDPGSRIDYGLKYSISDDEGRYSSAFVGQSYRLETDDVFAEGSGLEDRLSDIVGRVQVKPFDELDLTYRFRLDKDEIRARRSEFDVRVGPPALNLDLGYIFIDSADRGDEFGEREEVNWRIRSRLSQYWSIFGEQRFDLADDQTRRIQTGLTYQDECFYMQAVAQREFFSDREISPEDSVFVNVVFKHLGAVSSNP